MLPGVPGPGASGPPVPLYGAAAACDEAAGDVDVTASLVGVLGEISAILLPPPPPSVPEGCIRLVNMLESSALGPPLGPPGLGLPRSVLLVGRGSNVAPPRLLDGRGSNVAAPRLLGRSGLYRTASFVLAGGDGQFGCTPRLAYNALSDCGTIGP